MCNISCSACLVRGAGLVGCIAHNVALTLVILGDLGAISSDIIIQNGTGVVKALQQIYSRQCVHCTPSRVQMWKGYCVTKLQR